jgi:hypothetical protein
MQKFKEWIWLKENPIDQSQGQNDPGYQQLQQFFGTHKGRQIQFQVGNQMLTGILVDLLDEGIFVVQTADGQQHEVEPQHVRMR